MLASCASFSVDFLLSLTVQGDQGQVVAVGPFLLAFPSPLWPTPPHLRPVSIVWAVEVHFVICRLHFIQQAFPRMHLPFQNSPLKAYFPLSEYTLPFRTRFSCVLDRSFSAPSPCTGLPSSFSSPPRPPFVAPKAGAWRRIRRRRLRRRSTRVGNTTCRCLTLRLTPREASHRIQTKLAIRPLGGWTCLFAIGGRRDTGTWPWAMAEGRGTGAAFVGGADEWSTDARLVRRRERSERIGGRIEDAVPCA